VLLTQLRLALVVLVEFIRAHLRLVVQTVQSLAQAFLSLRLVVVVVVLLVSLAVLTVVVLVVLVVVVRH
jgi:hypothetical protein